jgi:hypothetical protein
MSGLWGPVEIRTVQVENLRTSRNGKELGIQGSPIGAQQFPSWIWIHGSSKFLNSTYTITWLIANTQKKSLLLGLKLLLKEKGFSSSKISKARYQVKQ